MGTLAGSQSGRCASEAPSSSGASSAQDVQLKATFRGNTQNQQGSSLHEAWGKQLENAIVFLVTGGQTVMCVMPHKRLRLRDQRGRVPQIAWGLRRLVPQFSMEVLRQGSSLAGICGKYVLSSPWPVYPDGLRKVTKDP